MAAWVRFVDEARRHRKRGGAAVTIQRHARGYLVRGARVSLSVCSLVFGFAPPRPRASSSSRLLVLAPRAPSVKNACAPAVGEGLGCVSFCRSRSLPHKALQSTLFASHSPQNVQQPVLSSFLLPSSLTYTRTHRTRLSNERHLVGERSVSGHPDDHSRLQPSHGCAAGPPIPAQGPGDRPPRRRRRPPASWVSTVPPKQRCSRKRTGLSERGVSDVLHGR